VRLQFVYGLNCSIIMALLGLPMNAPPELKEKPWLVLPARRLLLGRGLIGAVLLMNLQCALAFLLYPQGYAAQFELSGVPGEAAIRGIGVLFVMWNVPYAAALWHPHRQRLALQLAVIMQTIGLLGESAITLTLPPVHSLLRLSLSRFILFDALGLLALLLAVWLTKKISCRL